jgi:hypothetical protein
VNEELLERAAGRSVDPDRLLPGEHRDLRSSRCADAEHWVGVYSELIAFKVDIRQRTEAALTTICENARPEVQNDLLVMLAEEIRLVNRYEFWNERLRLLSAPPPPGHTPT